MTETGKEAGSGLELRSVTDALGIDHPDPSEEIASSASADEASS